MKSPEIASTAESEPVAHTNDEPSEGEAEILALETKLKEIREARRLRETTGRSTVR